MSEETPPTKQRIRAALDVLENYVDRNGKINATKMTQEIIQLRQRVTELEDERDIFKRTLDKRDKENERLRNALDTQFPGLVEISKDAERYRAAVSGESEVVDILIYVNGSWDCPISKEQADAVIDAEMKGGE